MFGSKLNKSLKDNPNPEDGDLIEILDSNHEYFWSIEEKNKFEEGIRIYGKNY